MKKGGRTKKYTEELTRLREMSTLRSALLGGVDGVITSFVVVAGASAGNFASHVVLVVGSSSVLADGLSMGVSEYLSSSAARAAGEQGRRNASPVLLGAVCFTSFVSCGAIPLLVFLLVRENLFSCAMFSLVELMLLGSARAHFTGEPLLVGLGQTTLLGAAAGGVAFGVGYVAANAG